MAIISMFVQIVPGVFFTPEGVVKWTSIGPSTARFQHFRYPRWFQYFTGIWELLVGIGFLVGLWFPFLFIIAQLCCLVGHHAGGETQENALTNAPIPVTLPAQQSIHRCEGRIQSGAKSSESGMVEARYLNHVECPPLFRS